MEMYNRILKIDANYPWANVEKCINIILITRTIIKEVMI